MSKSQLKQLADCSLYIGDLAQSTNEAKLYETITNIVPIATIGFTKDAMGGKYLGYGYIMYHNKMAAKDALNKCNFRQIDGNIYRLMRSNIKDMITLKSNGTVQDCQMTRKGIKELNNFNAFKYGIECRKDCIIIDAFKHLSFVFATSIHNQSIWCLDKKFECVYEIINDEHCNGPWQSVTIKENMIFAMEMVIGDKMNPYNPYNYDYGPVNKTGKMYRIAIQDLIPKQLQEKYRQFVWRPLIFGYIFSIKSQLNLSTDIPSDIDQLVLQYFNGFI